MAGEPIIIARNCAIVVVDEPLARGRIANKKIPQRLSAADLAGAIDAPLLDLRGGSDFVVDAFLLTKLAELKRCSLILMGALLEGAVTQVSLSTLLEGYDVYVCADLVRTAEEAHEALFFERIRYCNGHIVTSHQLLLELLSQEKDKDKRERLLTLLDNSVSG